MPLFLIIPDLAADEHCDVALSELVLTLAKFEPTLKRIL
jgi:hypothetical protein